jgi:hypothetical protein
MGLWLLRHHCSLRDVAVVRHAYHQFAQSRGARDIPDTDQKAGHSRVRLEAKRRV